MTQERPIEDDGTPVRAGSGEMFDGIARHTPEGYAFRARAQDAGFRQAVRERDEPYGDHGLSTFKG